jgi:hypothetical protein
MPTEDRDYHMDRARTELDRAYRTDNGAAARAHFGLASLHMQRIHEASTNPAESKSESLAEILGAAMP